MSTLTNTCDGCFEAKDEKSGLKTLPFKDLKFMACTGCRVTYYCSKVGDLFLPPQFAQHSSLYMVINVISRSAKQSPGRNTTNTSAGALQS